MWLLNTNSRICFHRSEVAQEFAFLISSQVMLILCPRTNYTLKTVVLDGFSVIEMLPRFSLVLYKVYHFVYIYMLYVKYLYILVNNQDMQWFKKLKGWGEALFYRYQFNFLYYGYDLNRQLSLIALPG